MTAPTGPDPAAPPVLVARGLTKVYRMGEVEVRALAGVDLDLRAGELVVLLGPSGSGKSTLVHILGGLDLPTAGELRFLGRDLARASERELTRHRRENVGFVFQFHNLVSGLTALENVALVTDLAADPMPPEEALARVGLSARRDHFPAQLSGGEQQRVAIARAIARRPRLLLCDEPTGSLDFATGRQVLGVIEDVNREVGAATLIITHNAPIAGLADRVLTLADGRIVGEEVHRSRRPVAELRW